jgi:flagellar motor switch protein FliN/FliY
MSNAEQAAKPGNESVSMAEQDVERMVSAVERLAGAAPQISPSINDLPISVRAVLGHKHMKISDIMKLRAGSILEIERRPGQFVDLVAGDKIIARGELVVCEGDPGELGVCIVEFGPGSD